MGKHVTVMILAVVLICLPLASTIFVVITLYKWNVFLVFRREGISYGPYTLSEEKKSVKNDEFFCQWRIFLPTIFLLSINFYRRIFLPTFFYKWEHYKNTLSLSIRLKIRLKLLKLNKITNDQGKRLMFF